MLLVKATRICIIALALFASLSSSAQSEKQERKARQKEFARIDRLKALVNSGETDSAFQLGNLYIHGWYTTPNVDSALKYMIIAQQNGSPEAMYQFGLWWENGIPTYGGIREGSKDRAQALGWFQKAAAKGFAPAVARVAEYQKAGGNGRAQADSLLQMGRYAEALPVLKLLADYNHDSLAMYQIAQIYRNGAAGVSASTSNYHEWLLKAGDNHYRGGARELATLYESMGARYEDDTRYWYSQAAAKEPNDAELARKRDYYDEAHKLRLARAEAARRESSNSPAQGVSQPAQGTTAGRRTRCANCNGTGKVTSSYTSENRNWDKKTITFTDHKETKVCNFCHGTGWLD